MTILFFKATDLQKPIRLAVHKMGNLGFTKAVERLLPLSEYKSVSIGRNAGDKNDSCLYMVFNKELNEQGFPIRINSGYYYADTALLFESLKMDYSKGKIAFNMTPLKDSDTTYYKLELVDREQVKSTKSR